MSREIMRQALDALRLVGKYTDSLTCYASTISEHEANIVDPNVQLAIAALEAELAKPEQEPVCYLWVNPETLFYEVDHCNHPLNELIPVYTSPPRKEQDESYGYAKRLAESIWKDHYKEISPHWRPFPTTLGVLTQIDNMIAGIERQRKEWQGLDDEDWANIPDFQKEGCELDAAIADWIEKRLKEKNT